MKIWTLIKNTYLLELTFTNNWKNSLKWFTAGAFILIEILTKDESYLHIQTEV